MAWYERYYFIADYLEKHIALVHSGILYEHMTDHITSHRINTACLYDDDYVVVCVVTHLLYDLVTFQQNLESQTMVAGRLQVDVKL